MNGNNVNSSKSFFTPLYQATLKSEHSKEMSDKRKYLDEQTKGGHEPYTQTVNWVNGNLASHGNDNISEEKIKSYVEDSKKVESGEMSNSHAYAKSAYEWAKEGNLTGVVMNTGAFIFSGAVDSRNEFRKGNLVDHNDPFL